MGMFAGADLDQERIMTAAVGVAVITEPDLVAAPARAARRGDGLQPERVKSLSLVAVLAATVVAVQPRRRRLPQRALRQPAAHRHLDHRRSLAAGETLVIITRNIDLSVGSTVGVAAYLTAELLAGNNGLPAVVAVAFAVGIGAVLGLVNGVLVAVARCRRSSSRSARCRSTAAC